MNAFAIYLLTISLAFFTVFVLCGIISAQVIFVFDLEILVPARIIIWRWAIRIRWVVIEIRCVYGTVYGWYDWRC